MIAGVRRLPEHAWNAALAGSQADLSTLSLPRHAVELDRSAGHFAVRYSMESLGSVPPDGQLHALTLLRRAGVVRRLFRCVPLHDDHVYQVAEFENPLEFPLLAGPVRLTRDGCFVGRSQVRYSGPRREIRTLLGLGGRPGGHARVRPRLRGDHRGL